LRVEAAAVSIMGQDLAVGFSDGAVWRFQDYTMFQWHKPIFHKAAVRAVALEPKGVYLASGSDNGRVMIAYGWQEPVPFDIRDGVRAIAWDPTARRLAVGADGSSLYVLYPTRRQPLAREEAAFPGETPKASAEAVSPGGKRRARVNGRDANVTLIETGRPGAVTFRGMCPRVLSVGFVGERLVTGCEDGSLELLDPAERKSVVRLPDHDPGYEKHVDVLAVRGGLVVTASRNGRVLLWDLDPQSWMRRACRRAGTDAKPCRSVGGTAAVSEPPAETP
jgi:WD40 repeat protein